MDARRDADADRRAVCGQRVPGSAPDLHDGTVLLQQSLSCKKPQLHLAVLWSWYSERPELRRIAERDCAESRPDSVGDSESLCEFIDILGMDFPY